MAYLVLARKWRPQIWEDVVGQHHVTATLRNAIQHDRLAHAYLFAGPRGVGKTSAARILAKALNCEQGPTPTPCNECGNCTEIAAGHSVDVFEIDGASNRGIDEIRNLRENIRYAPAHGKHKIYIIDEVHMLTNEAFNALLKTLEEPPAHVLFIFATTEPHRVPATIVSRCQRFDFHRIRSPDIVRHLRHICDSEKISVDDEALALIARKADGSLRDSQSILDQMISYTEEAITVETVSQALGVIDLDVFFEVTSILLAHDANQMMILIDRAVSKGIDLEEFVSGLTEHFRNLLIASASGRADLLHVSAADQKRYLDAAAQHHQADLLRLIRIITDTSFSLKRDPNPRITLELTLLKMVHLDKTVEIGSLLTALGNLERSGTKPSFSPAGSPENTKPPEKKTTVQGVADQSHARPRDSVPKPEETPPPPEPGLIPVTEIETRWDEVIEAVKKKKITIGSFLNEGVVHRIEGETLEIGFAVSNGFHVDAIMRCHHQVEDVLKHLFGIPLKIRCLKGDFSPPRIMPVTPEEKQAGLNELGKKSPVIQKLIDDFDVEAIE
ncbi:MAG TPA: DNA polymerase III subunit gamma/tau [bacterium]|nr:DNA polymerase III subunit gamma/tau [bacterium]